MSRHPHVIFLNAFVKFFIAFLWALLFHFKSFLCFYTFASQIIFNGFIEI